MNLARSISLVSLTAALAAPLAAQCSSGPFVGAPFTLSLADEPQGTFAGHRAYLKPTGFQVGSPGPWSSVTGVAPFRLADIFRACGAATGPYPEVDAMSLGEDWILADDNTGIVAMDPTNWGALTFSVRTGTVGAPGSAIRAASLSSEGAAAEVFSYVLPGSAMPAQLVGRTERVHGSREIDLGAGAHEIDALDHFVSMWALEPGIRAMMTDPPSWFFSVSTATLNAVPASWWNGTTPSGATIFYCTWNPTTASWTCPTVWKSYLALGLTAADDVDAIAVDERNQRILLSTSSATLDQLLFAYYGNDAVHLLPYKDIDGISFEEKMGLLVDDDIDAICAMDPSVRAHAVGGANAFWFAMGTPIDKLLPFPAAPVSSSAFRIFGAGAPGVRTFVSGWPNSGAGAGIAVLFLSPANAPLQWLQGPIIARDPTDPVCGNPLSVDLPVPVAVALSGSGVDLRWFLANQALTDVAEAFPVRVRL